MDKPKDIFDMLDDDQAPILAPALKVMNGAVKEGIIQKYVVGGSMAIMNYTEPFPTKDLDLFCFFPDQQGLLFSLAPIWTYLESLGYKSDGGLSMIVEGVPIQFLTPSTPLELEAMDTAILSDFEGQTVFVFRLEYAIAIKVQANRHKDWRHIDIAMESGCPDMIKLGEILVKFDLKDRWIKKGYEL